jgi:hypothetical protein
MAKMHASETSQTAQKPPRRRVWHWLAWTIAGIITFAFCWIGWQMATWHAYCQESQRSWNTLHTTLREGRPPNISQDEWDHGVDWAVNAHTNTFIGPEGASFQSMKQFGDQLDDKLKNEVDFSIFDWIWDQLEQAGPAGKQYGRYRALFQENLQLIRKQQLDAASDVEKFQGKWNLISAERDGKQTPSEEAKKIKLTIRYCRWIALLAGFYLAQFEIIPPALHFHAARLVVVQLKI